MRHSLTNTTYMKVRLRKTALKFLGTALLLVILAPSISYAQWTHTKGPQKGGILSLGRTGSTLVMGSNGGGFFTSTDNGESWSNAVSVGSYTAITSNGSTIFAAGVSTSVYRSTDSGVTWAHVGNAPGSSFVWALAMSGTTVFAGTDANGVARSTDDGATWSSVNTGLGSLQVWSLGVNGSTIYAGTSAGVYKSTDDGDNWSAANTGISTVQVRAIAFEGTNILIGTAADGVYLSSTDGASWTAVNTDLTSTDIKSLILVGASTLYAGTSQGGVFTSTNDGASWNAVSSGIIGTDIYALVASSSGASIFAGTGADGIFRTDDGGSNWHAKNVGLTASQIRALAVDGNTIYAGGFFNGISRSEDGGDTWTDTDLDESYVQAILLHSSSVFAGTTTGLYLSTNSGDSWTLKETGLPGGVQALADHGSTVFAAAYDGVYRTTNDGDSWDPASTGLPAYPEYVTTLALHDGKIFAGTASSGVYVSDDDGDSWTAVNTGLGSGSIRNLSSDGTILYAASTSNGIYKTADDGANWSSASSGLAVLTMKGLYATPTAVYAATFCDPGCIDISTDQGATWHYIGSGFSDAPQEITSGGGYLYAGSFGSGVYKSPLLFITLETPASATTGTDVTISGYGFDPTAANNHVDFNGVTATVTSATSTTLHVTVPDNATTGHVHVTVGSTSITGPDTFTVLPNVTGFSPAFGPEGTVVTVSGTGFDNSTALLYLGTLYISTRTVTPTSITFTIPTSSLSGKIKVQQGPDSSESTDSFEIIHSISSFTPTSGPVGTTVSVFGTRFSSTMSDNQITLNDEAVTTTFASAVDLTFDVPSDATSGKIKVTIGSHTVTSADNFTVTQGVDNFTPAYGVPGTTVVISGTNFSTTASEVRFNGTLATITSATPTALTVTVPSAATTGKVSVKVNGITVQSPYDFTVAGPSITSFDPGHGRAGTQVSIYGNYFSADAASDNVNFGALSAEIISVDQYTLVVKVPTGAVTDYISVTVGGMTATTTDKFTVTSPMPLTISSIDPTSGPPGTTLTITGTGFSTTGGNSVWFPVSENSWGPATITSSSATEIQVIVPSGIISGQIEVYADADMITSDQTFTVIDDGKSDQTITFPNPGPVTMGDPTFELGATASSGLVVFYTTDSDDKILLSGDFVVLTAPGMATITAYQPGNDLYNAAQDVSQAFCINPEKPTVTLSDENTALFTLTSSADAGNQWYFNGSAIEGATGNTYKPSEAGTYSLQVTVDGCTSQLSDEVPVIVTGIAQQSETQLRLYPNPVGETLYIISPYPTAKMNVRLAPMNGKQIESRTTTNATLAIDVRDYPAGLYIAVIECKGQRYYVKFVKQ